MSTITAKIVKNTLVISTPMVAKDSGSGKSTVVATTNGFIDTGVKYQGKSIRLSLNAFVPHKVATKEHEAAPGVKASIEKMNLTLIMTLDPHDSASGKNTTIATTKGNRPVGLKIGEKDLMVGVNAIIAK